MKGGKNEGRRLTVCDEGWKDGGKGGRQTDTDEGRTPGRKADRQSEKKEGAWYSGCTLLRFISYSH